MRALVFILILVLPLPLRAAGPILVDTEVTGLPVLWKDGVVHVNLESGADATLGTLSNAEAVALVRELFDDWTVTAIGGVATADVNFAEGETLGSVDASNLNDYFTYCPPGKACPTEDPPFVSGSARTGQSPILFDDDGSITDAIQGKGASLSILGFAGPRVVEREDGILTITEGQAVLNGKFINGTDAAADPEVPVEDFKGAIFHEIGHMIGLDHTQVNLGSAVKYLKGDQSESEAIPTMFPLFIDGAAQLTPHFDDRVAISSLYPATAFDAGFCRIDGTAFRADGTTELQGVNVIAANEADPLSESTSFVSGSLYTGTSPDCDAAAGGFVIAGLRPDVSYTLKFEPISQAFTGGSSIEPCDPPQKDFEAAALPGVFRCAAGGETITVGSESTTDVVTTKAVAVSPPSPPASSGDGGGCALVPPSRP
ncbi:MAG TPA: hypothetical protein VLJ37_08425 [bacterium]|nr:hypothetical protein [bacterium]